MVGLLPMSESVCAGWAKGESQIFWAPRSLYHVTAKKCNKTANISVKNCSLDTELTATNTSKITKITKKVILLSSTLTLTRCVVGNITFL